MRWGAVITTRRAIVTGLVGITVLVYLTNLELYGGTLNRHQGVRLLPPLSGNSHPRGGLLIPIGSALNVCQAVNLLVAVALRESAAYAKLGQQMVQRPAHTFDGGVQLHRSRLEGTSEDVIDAPEEERRYPDDTTEALPVVQDKSSDAPGSTQLRKKRRRSIWMPCYNDTEAERLGIRQWRSAKPKGMKTKVFDSIAKCWRKRGKNESLLPEEDIPSTASLSLRMDREWLETFLFIHRANIARLGKGFSEEDGGTLSDSTAVHEYLPANGSEALNPMRFRDCAAVGSGGSLSGSGQGKEIDSHELVLRVNEAPTDGYQSDVGKHTGMRLINNLWTDKYSKGPAQARPLEKELVLISTRADGDAFLDLGKWVTRRRPDVKLRLMSSRVVTAVRKGVLIPWRNLLNESHTEELEAAVLEGRDTPSSGLVAIFLLIQLCDQVTVYGFNGINDGSKYHYWKDPRKYMNRTHSFTAERALFRALHRDGLIRFVDGNPELIRTWV